MYFHKATVRSRDQRKIEGGEEEGKRGGKEEEKGHK